MLPQNDKKEKQKPNQPTNPKPKQIDFRLQWTKKEREEGKLEENNQHLPDI